MVCNDHNSRDDCYMALHYATSWSAMLNSWEGVCQFVGEQVNFKCWESIHLRMRNQYTRMWMDVTRCHSTSLIASLEAIVQGLALKGKATSRSRQSLKSFHHKWSKETMSFWFTHVLARSYHLLVRQWGQCHFGLRPNWQNSSSHSNHEWLWTQDRHSVAWIEIAYQPQPSCPLCKDDNGPGILILEPHSIRNALEPASSYSS
jgi:hypothetical protein